MLATEVMVPGPSRFNMVGQKLATELKLSAEAISPGLAKRIHAYAERALMEQGFGALAAEAKVTVYSVDGNEKPADRSYCVRWHTTKGGYIELIGILTSRGWPSLDHGFAIGYEEHSYGA